MYTTKRTNFKIPNFLDAVNIDDISGNFETTDRLMPVCFTVSLPSCRLRGDVDGDGYVTYEDLKKIKKHVEGTSLLTNETQLLCADVNGDGVIDATDVSIVEEYLNSNATIGKYFSDINNNYIRSGNLLYSNVTINRNFFERTSAYTYILLVEDYKLYSNICNVTNYEDNLGYRYLRIAFRDCCPASENYNPKIIVICFPNYDTKASSKYLTLYCGNVDRLVFKDIKIYSSNWSNDSPYPAYPYRYKIFLSTYPMNSVGIFTPHIEFKFNDVIGDNFLLTGETCTDGIYIYAKELPTSDFIIPRIILER